MTATPAHRLVRALGPAQNFLATLLLVGLTTLLAACGGSGSGSAATKVPTRQLTSIAVGPLQATVGLGAPQQFAATGMFDDGTKADVSASVTWGSGTTAVATISNAAGTTGLATTVSVGQTTITATQGGVAGSTTLTVSAATIATLALTAPYPSAAFGTLQQVTATGTYSDQTTHDVSAAAVWSTSDPSVATVSNTAGSVGLLTAVGPGVTTVTAVFGGATATLSITVTNAALASISVTRPAAGIAKGTHEQFTATGLYSDNTTQNITATVGWSSSNDAIATVGDTLGTKGLAAGVAEGAVTVQAMLGSISATNTLTITPATLVSLAIAPANPQLAAGAQRQLTAQGIFTDGSAQDLTNTVSWSSSATTVADVSNTAGTDGLAAAYGVGSATVTATLGTVAAATTLTVTPAVLTSIGVTPTLATVAKGTSRQFTAVGIYSDNTTQVLTTSVTWTSSDPTVATLSNAAGSKGLATTLAVGSLTVTATSGAIPSAPVTLNVTAATLVALAVSPASASIALGTSRQFTAVGTYTDASTQDLTGSVAWSTVPAGSSIASISNAAGTLGLADSHAQGSTAVTASLGTVVSPAAPLDVTAATLVSIAISPTNPNIAKGLTQAFTAMGTYSDQTRQDLTTTVVWTSSVPTVASISSTSGTNGIASSGATGNGTTCTTSISATLGAVPSNATTLTVNPATLVSITVTPATPMVLTGATLQFTATGLYTDGATPDLTATGIVTWHSSDVTLAQISNGPTPSIGLATGIASGDTVITADTTAPTITSTPLTLHVAQQHFAYAANYTEGTVSQYKIGVDGGLVALTPATVSSGATGSEPFSLIVHLSSRYVYVANFGLNSLAQFTANADGTLTAMTPATVSTGASPNAVTIDPSGKFVYVANFGNDTLSQFLVSPTDGSLSVIAAPIATGGQPASIAISANGQFAYVANYITKNVSQYTINATTGALTVMSPATVAAGVKPNSVAVDPAGHAVYVTNLTDNTVSQYAADPMTGALTPLTVPTAASGEYPFAIAIDPAGRHAYAANQRADTVSLYSIDATSGALTLAAATPVTTGAGPSFVAVDVTGQYAYIANRGAGTLSQYLVATDGSLSPLRIPTVTSGATTGSQPVSIATTP